jgi:hypothetical protein
MAQYKSEYSNTSVNSSPCAYTQLGSYLGSNYPHHGPVSGTYLTPHWGAIGYDALTHGGTAGSCNSYFNINHAYGNGSGNCHTKYTRRLCGGCDEPGSGYDGWVCSDEAGEGCVLAHKGTWHNGKTVYNHKNTCEEECGGGGKGMEYVCDASKIGGEPNCVGVHHGAKKPPGNVYPTSSQCKKECGGGGKGMEWVCEPSSKIGGAPHCVGVPNGKQKPHGNVYPTSYQCKENCNPVR